MKRSRSKTKDRFQELENKILGLLETAVKTRDQESANLAKQCLQTLTSLTALTGKQPGPSEVRITYVNDWRNSDDSEIPKTGVNVKMRLPQRNPE